jgi:hypothetical protein
MRRGARDDAMAMIAGWREIAKMFGLYATQRTRFVVSATGKARRREIEALPDSERLAMTQSVDTPEWKRGLFSCEISCVIHEVQNSS